MGYGNVDSELAKLSMSLRAIDKKLSEYNLDLVALLERKEKVSLGDAVVAVLDQQIAKKEDQISVCVNEQKRFEKAVLDYVRALAINRLVNNG